MATSPATPVIYSIKFLVFNSFTADFFAPKNGKCCKNQPVICSLHIFFVFSLFQHLLSNKHSLFSWKQSTKFTWLKYYQIRQFYFITLHISFFFSGTASITSKFCSFLAFFTRYWETSNSLQVFEMDQLSGSNVKNCIFSWAEIISNTFYNNSSSQFKLEHLEYWT